MFSRTWATLVVAGMAQTIAGCDTMNFSRNSAQLAQSTSLAQPGSGWRLTDLINAPSRNGRLTMTRDAALACERENAGFDLPLDGTVGDLDEVDRLAAHDLFDLPVPPALRCRDAHVAQLARGLHREKRRQMLLPREQVVDLHEVEARDAPMLAGLLDLRPAAGAGGDPDLVGGKEPRRLAELRQTVSDHFLRGAVHRRGVDHPAAGIEKVADDLGAGVASDAIVAHVERDPAAQTDHRQRLAARRNRAGKQGPSVARTRASAGARRLLPAPSSEPRTRRRSTHCTVCIALFRRVSSAIASL